MANIVGHTAALSVGGTPTTATGAACTSTSGASYQINTASRRIIDPATAVVAYDGGVPATIASIDYLFGIVTLSGVAAGAVTIDYKYIPLLALASPRTFEISCMNTILDQTVMATTTAVKSRMTGLKDASGNVGTLDALNTDLDTGTGGDQTLQSYFAASVAKFLDIALSNGKSFRAWILMDTIKTAGAVDGLIEGTFTWQAGPVAGVTYAAGASFGFGTA